MGVDDAVTDPDFGFAAPVSEAAPASLPEPAAPGELRLPGEPVSDARALARSCRTVVEIEAALRDYDGCRLRDTATHLCFGAGDPDARLLLIGEKPGAEEDRHGIPFVGRSGHLLDKMLAAVGIDRAGTFVTNAIYWRPPGNRPPTPEEIAACLPFLERTIELVRPALIVSLGGIAAKVLLDLTETVTRLRGRKLLYRPGGGEPVPLFVIFHPAYLLRNPMHKRLAWRDLLAVRAELKRLENV